MLLHDLERRSLGGLMVVDPVDIDAELDAVAPACLPERGNGRGKILRSPHLPIRSFVVAP